MIPSLASPTLHKIIIVGNGKKMQQDYFYEIFPPVQCITSNKKQKMPCLSIGRTGRGNFITSRSKLFKQLFFPS
jgi:hypothetical protein